MAQGEIWRRSRYLIADLVGLVRESEDGVRIRDALAVAEEHLDAEGRQRWTAKTVDNTIRDLVAFGVLRSSERGRDRVLLVTTLGEAWLRQLLVPHFSDLDEVEAFVLGEVLDG